MKFKIHGLLAGILVMTARYSVNLDIMGRSNDRRRDATAYVWSAPIIKKKRGEATEVNSAGITTKA
jgi:hypothetical protein